MIMKRIHYYTLWAILLVAITMLHVACKKDTPVEVDWSPVVIYIYATDTNGNSIVSDNMPGMSLSFKGKTYTVKDWQTAISESRLTKAYYARMIGLAAQPYNNDYRLFFGEIDGAADMDEDIILSWPDGSKDVIHYHCSDHKYGKEPSCKRSWKLNSQDHDGSTFTFSGKAL